VELDEVVDEAAAEVDVETELEATFVVVTVGAELDEVETEVVVVPLLAEFGRTKNNAWA